MEPSYESTEREKEGRNLNLHRHREAPRIALMALSGATIGVSSAFSEERSATVNFTAGSLGGLSEGTVNRMDCDAMYSDRAIDIHAPKTRGVSPHLLDLAVDPIRQIDGNRSVPLVQKGRAIRDHKKIPHRVYTLTIRRRRCVCGGIAGWPAPEFASRRGGRRAAH